MARTHTERRSQLLESLFVEAKEMRAAQRLYFKTRDRSAMQEAVHHEGRVDKIIKEIETASLYAKGENPAQAALFD